MARKSKIQSNRDSPVVRHRKILYRTLHILQHCHWQEETKILGSFVRDTHGLKSVESAGKRGVGQLEQALKLACGHLIVQDGPRKHDRIGQSRIEVQRHRELLAPPGHRLAHGHHGHLGGTGGRQQPFAVQERRGRRAVVVVRAALHAGIVGSHRHPDTKNGADLSCCCCCCRPLQTVCSGSRGSPSMHVTYAPAVAGLRGHVYFRADCVVLRSTVKT